MVAVACAALLLVCNTTSAQSDRGNRDYYNPGTTTDEKATWQSAHHFHLGPALEAMKHNDWKPAYDNFRFILYLFPNSPQALNGMSELCVTKWKSPNCDADSWFEKAIAVNPGIATTWTLYGIHLQREKHAAEAIEKFEHALKLRPDDINAHYNMGLAYFELKEYGKANEQAQISYSLGAPLPGLRDLLKREGRWDPHNQPQSTSGASANGRSSSE
jgi:tetratricopeptide (TPR) repeat protein